MSSLQQRVDDYGYMAVVHEDEPYFHNSFNYEDDADPSFVPSPWSSSDIDNDVTDDLVNSTTSFPPADTQQSLLRQFNVWYQGVHGYVSLAVCLFGIMSNGMNILVLTRRSMISPTNHLLTALAIADLLTMISYLPYAVYFYCLTVPDADYGHPMGWVVYLLFHTYFTITTHTAAMWLTVSLAVFRYLVVCCQQSVGTKYCSLHRAKVTIAAVFIATPIFCVPNYIKHRLYKRQPNDTVLHLILASPTTPLPTSSIAWVDATFDGDAIDRGNVWYENSDDVITTTALAMSNNETVDTGYWFTYSGYTTPIFDSVNNWLFGVVLKVFPCVMLAVLSGLLVRAMREAAEKRRRLLTAGRRDESERAGEHDRTTAMLVAVVLFFVATELPQGVLALLSGIDENIFEEVYVPLGDVFDLLVLVNSAVNFVLYCSMSRQFRRTFTEVFVDPLCSRKDKASAAAANGRVIVVGGKRSPGGGSGRRV